MGRLETDQRSNLSVQRERAVLVGVDLADARHDANESLNELMELAESAGAIIVATMLQKRARIDPKRYIGRGKVEELTNRVKQEEAEVVIFDDDLFTHDKAYLLSFCERYPGVSDVPLTVNAHVLRFDPEIAKALKAAGCRIVKFGVESGSPMIRRNVMNRHMSNETIIRAFATAREAGVETSAFLMFGLNDNRMGS